MSSFLKWIGGCLLLTLPFTFAQLASSPTETDFRAATSLSLSRFETRVSEIATAVQRRFASRVDAQPVGASFRASDPRHLPVRDRFLDEHFQPHRGHHFCTLNRDGKSWQVEIRGLKLNGPFPVDVPAGERALGISARLQYLVEAMSYRRSLHGAPVGNWNSGAPPDFTQLTMTLQDDDWSVDANLIPLVPLTRLRER